MCGENNLLCLELLLIGGSPPRVRGKRLMPKGKAPLSRITPACAGKTHPRGARGACSPDHPRVCGENRKIGRNRRKKCGSPPRVRGKHTFFTSSTENRRITPACAGKTHAAQCHVVKCSDHPRVCGENSPMRKSGFSRVGSPPRVRGKRAFKHELVCRERITPACAGKTLTSLLAPAHFTDHPRVCGENLSSGLIFSLAFGSPPRVRGKLALYHRFDAVSRITPACAGKTPAGLAGIRNATDHPRVCGENQEISRLLPLLFGSPPRVRGKPCNRIAE